jgi:hypothetical protein
MTRTDPRQQAIATLGFVLSVVVAGYVILAAKLGVAFAIPVGVVGFGCSVAIFKGPLGQALISGLGGGAQQSDETTGQLLAEVDEIRGRMSELEERVDFSERLLAQQSKGTDR